AQNLDVTAQPHEFGKPALQSLLEGKADLAIVADTPVMMAIAGGRNINIIAVIFTSNRGNAVVALKDRGISAPSDLEGRTIGVPLGTTADFFFDSLLTTHGVKRSQVVITDIKPGEMLDALQQGKVDAVSAWNPTLMQLRRRLGDRGVFFFDEAIYSDVACVVAEGSFVKSRPQSIEKLLQAFIEAEAFVKANPDESKRLITGFLNTEKELLDEIWNATDLRVSLDQSLIVDLEDQTRWAQENGLIGHQD
ncbi:MAG TPA: ABC transporter substrate-binding protein, partial [Syntrophobacteraceae bacterium]|nr:ABC transporter substrate-binding protein [Syntrophobacteraceae bacterium]